MRKTHMLDGETGDKTYCGVSINEHTCYVLKDFREVTCKRCLKGYGRSLIRKLVDAIRAYKAFHGKNIKMSIPR